MLNIFFGKVSSFSKTQKVAIVYGLTVEINQNNVPAFLPIQFKCFSNGLHFAHSLMPIMQNTPAKYPFTPKVADFAEQFLEASDSFRAYNRGKVFDCGRRG